MGGKKEKKQPEEGGSANWLCTFNDLMTLLMVFFVLIFTMGSLDLDKSSGMIDSLQSGLGVLEGGQRVDVSVVDPTLSTAQMENDMGNLREVYTEILQDLSEQEGQTGGPGEEDTEAGVENNEVIRNYMPNSQLKNIKLMPGISTTYTAQGIYITLDDRLLFESGEAKINLLGYPILDRVANATKKSLYSVRIEGHTDDRPIHTTRYPSNWELSMDRSVRVLKYFIDKGIPPSKLSAVGYGDVKPLCHNNTPENRAKNRRVEIVLVNKRKL
jgi:chemotaxis protein MotB